MPDFLVSVAMGALGPVLGKLAALLGEEYKRFKGVRGEVKFLIRELEAMHVFLLKKSEEENPDAQDKAWMKEVRELSYDIEDSLDDFRVRVDDGSAKPDGFIDKCKNLLAKTKARRWIAKEIEKLKGQVKEVSERNARYKQNGETVMNTSKVIVDPRALAIFQDASRLVGIDKQKQEVISFLNKEDDGGISSQQPKIVSIVGIGGIGKTTLANRVYQELRDQFQCRAFLSVSRNPDMVKIFRTILSEVTGRPYYKTEAGSIQQLIMAINEFLQKKRYFIVVDDVWDVETWDTIKYALSNNSCGSVIITTTRIHDVAKACCLLYSNGWVYHLKPLQEQDSKRLFQNRIFGLGNECPKNLEEVSSMILKKCGGLPLAIIAISGLLANKARNGVHSVTEWDQVQTSIGHGLERDSTVEGMMEILSLSYFDLPFHLKACLLYLSSFPEDYVIEKDCLVRLWVAEGFIPAESTCTLYESGEKSFNELINRNLIFPWKIKEWNGETDCCRLHDTILDFVVHKSTEDNFVTVHGIPRLTPPPRIKVRRLSLQGKTEGDVTLRSNQNYANIRSIICFGFPCSLVGVRFLRVLDFMGCERLLKNHDLANIGELLQLRYLSLRHTGITELPEQIGALQYLETLDMWGCCIFQLPTSIVRLKRLVNLLMGPLQQNCFPSGIKNMQALEELSSVQIDINAGAIYFEEIGDLTNMRRLGISLFTYSGTFDEESYVDLIKKMVSSFQRLNKLQTLDVQFDNFGVGGPAVIFNGDDVILEVPWCSASLRKLVLKMNPMSRVPSWMKSHVNIEQLVLRVKKLEQESLCILGNLPALVDLTLELGERGNNVEDVPSTDKRRFLVSNSYGFRSLRRFRAERSFSWYSSMPMLTFEAGSMPKLEYLCIAFDADITISVTNGHLDFGLNHLSQLTEMECVILGSELSASSVKDSIEEALVNHPNRPDFTFDYYYFPTEDESEQEVVSSPETSGDDKTSSTTTDDNQRQWLTAALPLSTDLSFAIDLSRGLAHRHGQQRRRSKARMDATIRGRELLVQGAPLIPDRVKGTSGGDDKVSSSTKDNTDQSLTAALPLPTDLSFSIHHRGASFEPGRRHGQRRHRSKVRLGNRSKVRLGATIHRRELVQGAPLIPNCDKGTSGAARSTSAVLITGIAAPQQQEAIMPPCFTFSSGSLPNAEAEQQATPLQRDDLANAFSSAFDGLSLRNDQPGSSATAVEAASLNTGAAPTSDVVESQNIAAPQQHASISEAEQKAMDHVNACSSTLSGLSLHDDHPGSSATSVEAASSGAGSSSCKEGGGRQEQQ